MNESMAQGHVRGVGVTSPLGTGIEKLLANRRHFAKFYFQRVLAAVLHQEENPTHAASII